MNINDLNEHTICSFPHGSRVYGVKPTVYSDIDIVTIVDDTFDFSEYTNHIYEFKTLVDGIEKDTQYIRESDFIEMVKNHHIIALESLWLPSDKYEGKYDYLKYFELDKWKLRQTISSIVNNAPGEIARVLGGGSTKITEFPEEATKSEPMNTARNAVIGLVAGAAIAMVIIFLVNMFDTRVKSKDELVEKYGFPILGEIPNLNPNG